MPMRRHNGKSEIPVEKIVENRETVSPGYKERAGLIALIIRAVDSERTAMKIKESVNAFLIRTRPPK